MGVGRNLAIGASVIAIVGAGGYLAWAYYFKPKMDAKAKKPGSVPGSTGAGTTSNTGIKPPTVTPVVVPPGKLTPVVVPPPASMPFTNVDDIKAFQNWLDVMHPTWVNGGRLNKGNGYGSFGPSTSAAYSAFKQEYCDITGICPSGLVRGQQPPSTTPTSSLNTNLNMAKPYIESIASSLWKEGITPNKQNPNIIDKYQFSTWDYGKYPKDFISFYNGGLFTIEKVASQSSGPTQKIEGQWAEGNGKVYILVNGKQVAIDLSDNMAIWTLLISLGYQTSDRKYIPFEGESSSEKSAPKPLTKTVKNSSSRRVTNELCNVNDGCTLDDSGTPRVFTLG